MIPDRVYLCPLIYGQIDFYCRLLSCTIRADGISVNGGIHRHRPVCVEVVPLTIDLLPTAGKHHSGRLIQPVPLLVVGEQALHWFPVSVIAPLAAVVLLPAVCGLRVNDDLHKPPQDGGDFSAGGSSLGVKAVICLASQDARLLHGLDRILRPAADLCVVRKSHRPEGFRKVVAQLFGVICHDDRHLFPVDVGVRRKGSGGNAFHNAVLRRPVHIGGIVGVGFHIGEFPGLVTVRVDARQPPQSCHKHSSGHAGARAKGGVTCAREQSPAGCKEDIVRSPMVMNVGKGRGRVLVAHAVNAEMTGFKNHRFQAGIVAGSTLPASST